VEQVEQVEQMVVLVLVYQVEIDQQEKQFQ